jgi:hypothetical protein
MWFKSDEKLNRRVVSFLHRLIAIVVVILLLCAFGVQEAFVPAAGILWPVPNRNVVMG